MKNLIETLLAEALAQLPEDLVPAAARGVGIEVESTRDTQHGDFATNLAMRLAKATRQNPRKIAEALLQPDAGERRRFQGGDRRRRVHQLLFDAERLSR